MNGAELAELLRAAVQALHFEQAPDALQGGAPVGVHPSIDLAVAAFPVGGAPVWANVLFSREHPQGLVADIAADAGPVRNIAFVADPLDAQGRSAAWLPGSDWDTLRWEPLAGEGPQRFVAPYPASLIKLMVLVGVARLVDQGRSHWRQLLSFEGEARPVGDWAYDMTVVSCNRSTSALVAHLHGCGALGPQRNELHETFEALGLRTLRLDRTRPDGGWRNGDGAGVGRRQMTAWDCLRLLWLLDPDAPPAPWLKAGSESGQGQGTVLLGESLAHVLLCLREQRLHHILSSGTVRGQPGWIEGLPARLPGTQGGSVLFAHKTGNTENYSADAGIVRGIAPARRHYLIALTSSLGSRYAPSAACATDWRLPALGAAIDAALRASLEERGRLDG
jgi:hypothetical protein